MITLFPEKENVARILTSFEVVANDFLEHILAGAGMSTSWNLPGEIHEFYIIVKGMTFVFDSLSCVFLFLFSFSLPFCYLCKRVSFIGVEKRFLFTDLLDKSGPINCFSGRLTCLIKCSRRSISRYISLLLELFFFKRPNAWRLVCQAPVLRRGFYMRFLWEVYLNFLLCLLRITNRVC